MRKLSQGEKFKEVDAQEECEKELNLESIVMARKEAEKIVRLMIFCYESVILLKSM